MKTTETNTERNTNGIGISNVYFCSPQSLGTPYNSERVVERIVENFVLAASGLRKNACLSFRLNFLENKQIKLHAFTSQDERVSSDDFSWMFGGCMELKDAAMNGESFSEIFENCSRFYSLVPDGKSRDEGAEMDNIRFIDLFDALSDNAATLLISAFADLSGSVLIGLSKPVDLRLRTLLAICFPGTAVMEISEDDATSHIVGELDSSDIRTGLSGLITRLAAAKRFEELFADDDDEFDEDDFDGFCALAEMECDPDEKPQEGPKGMTPLYTLKLGPCEVSALVRSGINSVEQLRALSDIELKTLPYVSISDYMNIKKVLRTLPPLLAEKEPFKEKPAKNALDELEELIGLEEVKRQVRMICAYAIMKSDMKKRGIETSSLALNMQFVGNPGTAKTTVARIIAGVFHEVGLLESGEAIEVGRAGLVGQYVGETARKVSSVFEKADGRLLFIDEAYSLLDDRRGLYGDEAINTIVQEMENRRDRTIVIFAGYPDEMEGFIDANPGLRSRVPFKVDFGDYSAGELRDICALEAKRRGFSIDESAAETLLAVCAKAVDRPEAGNGRFCRNLVESAILRYADTHYGAEAQQNADGERTREFVLEAKHFDSSELLLDCKKSDKNSIGFKS